MINIIINIKSTKLELKIVVIIIEHPNSF